MVFVVPSRPENCSATFETTPTKTFSVGASISPICCARTVSLIVSCFQAKPALFTPSVCSLNAMSVAPAVFCISFSFVSNELACPSVRAITATPASTDPHRPASSIALPPAAPCSAVKAPCSPRDSSIAAPLAYPRLAVAAAIAFDGVIKPCNTARNCVDTSAAPPVTPVSVAIVPNRSSMGIPIAAAMGVTLPIDAASSGNVVWPSRTVCNARSLTLPTAVADVSP
ncbi:MAG: hypothetical protein DDT38_01517 [Firmicutes bacterium]|nr:hypothetical protein [candidate division NPL-UPA2 bacterium]